MLVCKEEKVNGWAGAFLPILIVHLPPWVLVPSDLLVYVRMLSAVICGGKGVENIQQRSAQMSYIILPF